MEAKAHSLNAGLGTLAIAIGATVAQVILGLLLAQFFPPQARARKFPRTFPAFFPILMRPSF